MVLNSTIAGGIGAAIISGLVGVFIVEYRYMIDDEAELEAWYTRTIRLSERVVNAEDDVVVGAFHMMEKLPYMRNTCAGVHTMMAEHLTEAPSEVDSDIIEKGENLVQGCQLVKDTDINHENFLSNFRQAQEIAEDLISETEAAR